MRVSLVDHGTPVTPGTPPGTRHRAGATPGTAPRLAELREVALGSLLAATVDRLARHVPWPGTRTLLTPLIGTPGHAPVSLLTRP